MLERITAIFQSIGRERAAEGEPAFAPDDPRLAAAALMHHVIEADGILHDVERQRFAEILQETYGLDDKRLGELVEAARDADSEAVDLYQFTSVLMRSTSADERRDLIEALWEMVFADGEIHELEDNIVWRISELLGVDGRDRILMRNAVMARLSAETGGE
ncbi:TerB family tellurite resistance protein [Oricola sp.]|uniref:tellurite resistance TerB family protein n=1 Tax=Oricola sp. TaxID=1979950 RepID=UPI003BAB6CDA